MTFDRIIGFIWGVSVGVHLASGHTAYAAISTALCFVIGIVFPVKSRG